MALPFQHGTEYPSQRYREIIEPTLIIGAENRKHEVDSKNVPETTSQSETPGGRNPYV